MAAGCDIRPAGPRSLLYDGPFWCGVGAEPDDLMGVGYGSTRTFQSASFVVGLNVDKFTKNILFYLTERGFLWIYTVHEIVQNITNEYGILL